MTDKFVDVLEDIEKGIEYPFKHTAQVVELLHDALKDSPAVKAAIVELVELGEKVVPDVLSDVAAKGLNLTTDEQTISDVQAFFAYFGSTFLPAVETAYSDLKDTVDTSAVTTTTTTTTIVPTS